MQKQTDESLTTGAISQHIRRIAAPMSVGFFFNTMYNVVDSFFAGQISTSALAAMGISFPVYFILIAISEGMARGSSALMANAIGEKNEAKQAVLAGQMFSLLLFLALGVSVVGMWAAEPLFRLLGAKDDYLISATQYITPIFMGSVFFLLSSFSNAILVANGDGRTFGKVLIAGFFLNLVMNPWFLYGGFGVPAMGIAGIAWATVTIQAITGLILFFTAVRRGHINLRRSGDFLPKAKVYGEILWQGIPASFNMMTVAVGFFAINYFLQFYGEASVAAFGIGTRIEQIALLPTIGLGAAIVAIVGQNNGAGEFQRVRECLRLCLKYGMALIVIGSVLIFIFARSLLGFFTDDPEVIEIGTNFVRIMACIEWVYVVTFICVGFLQAIKKPLYGLFEGLIRKALLPILVLYWVVDIWQSELIWVWWGMVVVNLLVTVFTVFYTTKMVRKYLPDQAGDRGI